MKANGDSSLLNLWPCNVIYKMKTNNHMPGANVINKL